MEQKNQQMFLVLMIVPFEWGQQILKILNRMLVIGS